MSCGDNDPERNGTDPCTRTSHTERFGDNISESGTGSAARFFLPKSDTQVKSGAARFSGRPYHDVLNAAVRFFLIDTALPMKSSAPWSSASRLCVLAFVFLLVGSTATVAQPTVSVRGNVGASFFRAPELQSELLNSGTSLGLEAGIRVYRGLAVTVGVGYDGFTLNKENARLFNTGGGDLTFRSGMLGLRYTYRSSSDAHPYLTVGVGRYQLRSTNRRTVADGELVATGEETKEVRTASHLALGSLFRLDDTYALFFEPRFVFYDLSGGLGNTVRYFTLRLGVDVQI